MLTKSLWRSLAVISFLFFPYAVETATRLYELTGEMEYLEKALEYSQKSKSFVLRQAIFKEYSSELDGEMELREVIRDLEYNYRRMPNADIEGRNMLLKQIHESKQDLWNLIHAAATDDPANYLSRFSDETTDLSELQSKLDNKSAIIDFKTPMVDSSIAIIITKNAVDIVHYSNLLEVQDLIKLFKDELANGSAFFAEVSHDLYRKAFLPIISKIPEGVKHLIISPDYVTWEVSFEALAYELESEAKGKFLTDKFSFSYQPILGNISTHGLARNDENATIAGLVAGYSQKTGNQEALLVGCLDDSTLVDDLEMIQKVVEQIIREDQADQIFYPAKKEDFISNADEHQIVIVGAHGCAETGDSIEVNPLDYGVIFSTGGQAFPILRLGEIYDLEFKKNRTFISCFMQYRLGQITTRRRVVEYQ